MDKQRLQILFQKNIEKTISENEKKEFFNLLAEPSSLEFLRALSKEIDISEHLSSEMSSEATQKVWENILLQKKRAIGKGKNFIYNKMENSRGNNCGVFDADWKL